MVTNQSQNFIGNRCEIYNEQLFELTTPPLLHQDIIGKLGVALMLCFPKPNSITIYSPNLYINEHNLFIPDLAFYNKHSLANPKVLKNPHYLLFAPHLIIEVISPSTKRNDRVHKVKAYAEFSVKNYWIIDPENKTLEALELRDGVYSIVDSLEDEEQFRPKNFPELVVELRTLWSLEA